MLQSPRGTGLGPSISKLDEIQPEIYRYLKKILFTISKIFENVLFFGHMHYRRKTNWVIPELGKQTGFYFKT